MTAISQAKQRLRTELKKRRAGLPESQRQQEETAILTTLLAEEALLNAHRVFCFISHGDEVDTHGLINELLRQGKRIVVPKILPGGMIAVPFSDWSDLEPGQLGIPTPVSSRECRDRIDACITPGLAFTESGKRLGYGRGYYDHWFAGHPVEHRIGIAYDCQVVDELPADERDVPVTLLVTGSRRIVID